MKKFLLMLALTLIPVAIAPAYAADFSTMNPTVKVTSYKYLFNGQVQAYGSGSGTVLTSDGLVLTNNHVVFDENEGKTLDAFEVCITFSVSADPVCTYTASLLANDKDIDLALLKIQPKDVYGNDVSGLKFLMPSPDASPKTSDPVQILGYPGSGGESITITKGQISGYDTFSDHTYFKTDTDIDHGNSGGTTIDAQGRFIGIPTFIRSYAENFGYFLDAREAIPFIESSRIKAETLNADANRELEKKLKQLDTAQTTLKYESANYPRISIQIPSDWHFNEINIDSFFIEQKKTNAPASLSFFFQPYSFEINDGFMKKLDEKLASLKENYPDYKKVPTTVSGIPAFEMTYTSFSHKNTTIFIPYGTVLVGYTYGVDLDNSALQQAAIDSVLKTFKFLDKPQNDPNLPAKFVHTHPDFSIESAGNFRIMPYDRSDSMTLVAEGYEKDNYDGDFTIEYKTVPKDQVDLSNKERLDDVTKNLNQSGTKITYKNDAVILDGLSGHLYIQEYEGNQYQEIHKKLTVVLRDGDFEYEIGYDDLAAAFDRNLPTIETMLNSFTVNQKGLKDKGVHKLGTLGSQFSDIQYHRFASEISDLAQNGILQGFSDGTFRPEASVTRAEALKMILESKNKLEEKKDRGKTVDFSPYADKTSDFKDVKKNAWFLKYITYASEKKLADGFSNKTFRPNQSVTLGEGLKWVLSIYEIPIWNGQTQPWSKKYIDKAYELSLLPQGLTDPNQTLTRAELAYLISTLFNDAKQ